MLYSIANTNGDIMSVNQANFWYWVVSNIVPKRLVYFAAMYVLAEASVTTFADTDIGVISGLSAIKDYCDKHDLEDSN